MGMLAVTLTPCRLARSSFSTRVVPSTILTAASAGLEGLLCFGVSSGTTLPARASATPSRMALVAGSESVLTRRLGFDPSSVASRDAPLSTQRLRYAYAVASHLSKAIAKISI